MSQRYEREREKLFGWTQEIEKSLDKYLSISISMYYNKFILI